MFDSPIIDVALGLFLVFWLLATLASAVNEVVESFLRRRADFLEASLGSLMGTSYAANILNHPIIKRSNPGRGAPDISGFTKIRNSVRRFVKRIRYLLRKLVVPGGAGVEGRPSYIPTRAFSSTVLDLLEGGAQTAELRWVQIRDSVAALKAREVPSWVVRSLATYEAEMSEDARLAAITDAAQTQLTAVPGDPTAAAVIQQAGSAGKIKRKLVDIHVVLHGAADNVLTSREAMKALERYITEVKATGGTAAEQIERLEKRVGQWFDDAMDRVSGWYKRRTKALLLVWSVVAVLVLNVDTFAMSSTLWNNDAVREAVVAQAEQVAANPKTCTPDPADPFKCVTDGVNSIEELRLPIGWPGAPWDWDSADPRVPSDAGAWFAKFFGLLFTAGAAAMGAPFWFDLMNKVINVRSSGKPPEREAATS